MAASRSRIKTSSAPNRYPDDALAGCRHHDVRVQDQCRLAIQAESPQTGHGEEGGVHPTARFHLVETRPDVAAQQFNAQVGPLMQNL